MDQAAKKVQCCNDLKAQVETYAQLAEGASDAELARMNEAADRAIMAMKGAFSVVVEGRDGRGSGAPIWAKRRGGEDQ